MATKHRLMFFVLCLLSVAFCLAGLSACAAKGGFGKQNASTPTAADEFSTDADELPTDATQPPATDGCDHAWSAWTVTDAASCTEEGRKVRTCGQCGATETGTVPALGHDLIDHDAQAPSCTTTGWYAYQTCSRCDYSTYREREATGHDWADATCTAPVTCRTCGATEGEALGHTFELEIVRDEALKSAATCTQAAVYYKSCHCGAVSTDDADTFVYGLPAEHVYDREVVRDEALKSAATHAEGAVYYKSCACGAIGTGAANTFTYGDPVPHTYDQNVVRDAALKSAADCTHAAVYYKSCSCGAIGTETFTFGEALGHAYTSEVVKEAALKSAATCTSPAVYYKSCSCGDVSTNPAETFVSGEPLPHTYDREIVKDAALKSAATCSSPAIYYKSCACGAISEDPADVFASGSPLSHDYELISSTSATCTQAATETYRCKLCGDEYTETVGPALGHDIGGVEPVERLVEGCEYVLVYTCQRDGCGAEVEGEHVFHHHYVASITQPATCMADGEKTLTCACGATKTEVIPKDEENGHRWVMGDDVVAGSVRVDECSICHKTKSVVVYGGTSTDSTDAGELRDTEIALSDASIALDDGVIDAIGDKQVTVSADKIEGDDREDLGLSAEQLAQVGDHPIYNFTINDGTGNISQFGDDNWATITLPYTLAEGEDVDSIAVWFISDAGVLESYPAVYNNGCVTFKTNHFSYYTVTRLTPSERCALYGHNYTVKHVEGSCTEDGYDLHVCARCHDTYTDNVVPATGHDYAVETHDATCTADGYVLYTCGHCGHTYRTRIRATGHSYVVRSSVEASCEAGGCTVYVCETCGATYTVLTDKLPHTYRETVAAPTCEAYGYTEHVCEVCGDRYTDAYLPALGHDYAAAGWTWSEDLSSAVLTLVCRRDATHEHTLSADVGKTVTVSACSDYTRTVYTAAVSFDGVLYTDEKVFEEGEPGHVFGDEWQHDAASHWHECVCGERTDVAAHAFGQAVITKEPTCAETGEKIETCVCGATKVTVIPATGEHHYENGRCVTCGKIEETCDHTHLHEVSFDFSTIGACGFVLWYDTCDCGAVKILNAEKSEMTNIACSFENEQMSQFIDELGRPCQRMQATCSVCGLTIAGIAVQTSDGCTMTYEAEYSFIFGGEVVLDHVTLTQSHTSHYTIVRERLDLSPYSTCGGYAVVEKCSRCGEILHIVDFAINCDLDFAEEPTEVVIDGVTHYVYEVTCPDCGLRFVEDGWILQSSPCEKEIHEAIRIYRGTDVIFAFEDSEFDNTHEWEYTYELVGETCEDGCVVTAHCPICGVTDSWRTYGHKNEEFEIDLGEYGCCEGSIYGQRCAICGQTNGNVRYDIGCIFPEGSDGEPVGDSGEEPVGVPDENGVLHDRTSRTCPKCGLTIVTDRWTEEESACVTVAYGSITFIKNGETIFETVDRREDARHQYEYTYEMFGETCGDGYRVTAHCKKCGETETWQSYGHRNENFDLDLSEYGGCGGRIAGRRCAVCGHVDHIDDLQIACDFDDVPEPVEFADENGVTHYLVEATCPDCGLTFVQETWEVRYSECEAVTYVSLRIRKGGEVLVDVTDSNKQESHRYETTYVMRGETCDDGYEIVVRCSVCGKDEKGGFASGHRTEREEYDLGELGLCGGHAAVERCVICGEVLWFDIYSECDWTRLQTADGDVGDDGEEVFWCEQCGAVRIVRTFASPKDEHCVVTITEAVALLVDGEEVWSCETERKETSHRYLDSFELLGETCADGVRVTRTCADCGEVERYTTNNHVGFVAFELTDEYDCCEHHALRVYECACGDRFRFEIDGFAYDEDTESYFCRECGLRVTESDETAEDGCTAYEYYTFVVEKDGEELYRFEWESSCPNHSFSDVRVETEGGTTRIVSTCSKCGQTVVTERSVAVLSDHGNEEYRWYYDLVFVPEVTGSYTIESFADSDTYVTLYERIGGVLREIDSDDDGGFDSQFLLTHRLEAGAAYVYRIRFYHAENGGSIAYTFGMTGGASESGDCPHDRTIGFAVLAEGSETCEDGAYIGSVCRRCGHVSEMRYVTEHETVPTEFVDLAEHGACDGSVFLLYTCACGHRCDYDLYLDCDTVYTDNEYIDEDGHLIRVEVETCRRCGLRRTRSWYTEEIPEFCTAITYYSVTISVGDELIADFAYTTEEEIHDYAVTTELYGSSCEDGVKITYRCRRCGDEHTETVYNHSQLESERIDLAQLGSTCGGYAVVYRCACGRHAYVSIEHCLCDLNGQPCQLWIGNAVTSGQYTIDGWQYFGYSCTLYKCAVTDPACAFAIRYARYWLRDADACVARQYETWQIGYDEETGTCAREITVATGSTRICHAYTVTETDHSTHYDCALCGSYRHIDRVYDGNGNLVKETESYRNTLGDGRPVYHETIIEYVRADGFDYTSRDYRRTVYADGSEYVSETQREESPYTGPFGDSGRRIRETTTRSDGDRFEYDYAYVCYMGYQYDIFEYRTESTYWYRYDYAYRFDGECLRITYYENSDSGARTYTENCCHYNTVTALDPTCSQQGLRYDQCQICGHVSETYATDPYDHDWCEIGDGRWYCERCGLESSNGASGSIIMEDLTEAYGDGAYYVAGYHKWNEVEFSHYVCLVLSDGTEVIVPDVALIDLEGLSAIAFEKAAVEAYADANGYTDYEVRFVFVPYGPDSSFDYAITFGSKEIGTVTDDCAFVVYVGENGEACVTLSDEEGGRWTVTSSSRNDTYGYLLDEDGNVLMSDDDNGEGGNFRLTFAIEEGGSRVIKARWYSDSRAGYMALVFKRADG